MHQVTEKSKILPVKVYLALIIFDPKQAVNVHKRLMEKWNKKQFRSRKKSRMSTQTSGDHRGHQTIFIMESNIKCLIKITQEKSAQVPVIKVSKAFSV